jgi:hypothetical protein
LFPIDVQSEEVIAIAAEEVFIPSPDKKWIEYAGGALEDRYRSRAGLADEAQDDIVRIGFCRPGGSLDDAKRAMAFHCTILLATRRTFGRT